jgi:hypothetical protein
LILLAFLIFLIAYSSAHSADVSVYEQANEAAWRAIQAKEAIQREGGDLQAKTIKTKIQDLVASGKFKASNTSAVNVAKRARHSTLEALNALPNGDSATAIDRIMTPGRVFVFISKSMPRGQLLSLLKSLEHINLDVEVAYRGLWEGNRTIMDAFRQSGRMLRDFGVKRLGAEFNMNPTAFREAGVTVVPTMVYVHGDRQLSRVTGSVNIRSFHESIEDAPKDFGNEGAVFEIQEKDFFVEIQERMAKIDWKQKVEQAKKTFWNKITPYNIPVSSEYESFDVDMTVVVNQDIYAEYNGKKHVIARSGDRFNPLDRPEMAQFNRRMLVFNPNDGKQALWAEDQVRNALSLNERPVIMLTELLATDKHKTFSVLEERYKMPIYLLQDKVITTFNLTQIPAAIKRVSDYSGSMRVTYFNCSKGEACSE